MARRAFTLIELLVVIGIITILTGILLPVVARARASGRQTKGLSDLRQMLLGYTMYHQANNGAVLFGYPPATVEGWTLTVDDPISKQTFGFPLASRYPWRLVTYVNNVWPVVHGHDSMPPLPLATDSASAAFNKAYIISLGPTFGINSVYIGGDSGYAGFVTNATTGVVSPNTGHHVVFKANQVRNPSGLIVLADSTTANIPGLGGQGYHLLTPPRANGLKWTVKNGVAVPAAEFAMGLPHGWYTARVCTGFFDGHADAKLPAELTDMHLWANWATSADYDYVP